MKYKTCPAALKTPVVTDVDEGAGEFEALVSVFGNVDSMGDVVKAGAFTDTLAAWHSSKDTMPVLWSHRMDDPAYNIGAVVEAEEVYAGDKRIPDWASPHVHAHGGLWVKGVIDTGPDASPVARQARRLLAARRVTQFSYAYDVLDEAKNADGHNELNRLWLHEISPTQVGANQLTELAGAKADPVDEPPARRAGTDPHLFRARCDLASLAVRLIP